MDTQNAYSGMCSRLFLTRNKAYVLFLTPKGKEIYRDIESPRMRGNLRAGIHAEETLEKMDLYSRGKHQGLRGAELLESLRKADTPYEREDAEHWLKRFAKHGKEAQYWLASETPKSANASVSQLIWALAHKDLSPIAIKMLAVYGTRAERSLRYLLKKLELKAAESFAIAAALPHLDPIGKTGVPALISCLSSGKVRLLRETLKSLASYGPKARQALPAIKKHLTHQNSAVRSEAKKARKAIEVKTGR